jgi:CheY-like chemotaxis protein
MSLAKVLFVDDEVPFVDALSKRLTKRDLEILPAYNGDEALKLLAEQAGFST